MIYFLGTQRHTNQIHAFLSDWGRELAGRIATITYEHLLSGAQVGLPRGTYILQSLGSDLGSRNPPSPARQAIVRLRNFLVEHHGPQRVLNDPVTSLRRYDLLKTLRERGYNGFAAYRADRPGSPERYPVFLRLARGSMWNPPQLLRNEEEYRAAVARAGDLDGVLAVELCDTADSAGIYRKYACFIVGDRIVPRHLFFSRRWWVKEADLREPAMLEEELAFLDTNPYAQTLLDAARIANISYGRIDYAVLDGRPQVWEINVSPLIATGISSKLSERTPVHRKFVALFGAALDAIDPPAA